MFCMQCRKQIDQEMNFCPNCGARIAKATQPSFDRTTLELEQPPSPIEMDTRTQFISAPNYMDETQAVRLPPSESGRGFKQIVIVAAAIVILAGAVGIYFGTDLLREIPKQEITAVTQSPAVPEVPATSSPGDESKTPSETKESDLWSPAQPALPEAQPPMQAEPAKPAPESKPKATIPTESPTPPQRAQRERDAARPPLSSSPSQARLPGNPGTYETIRSTDLFAEPSLSSKVVSSIDSGIRVNVVGANGEWLEVRSRFGNPPGFIRRGDTKAVGRAD